MHGTHAIVVRVHGEFMHEHGKGCLHRDFAGFQVGRVKITRCMKDLNSFHWSKCMEELYWERL
jgi:hypothetical protein